MRRIKLRYTGGSGLVPERAQWELIDLDTGLPIPYVQGLRFEIQAETMLPKLTLELIPEQIEIEGPMLVHDLGGKRYFAGRQEVPMLKDAIFSWMPPVDAESAKGPLAEFLPGGYYEPQPPEERRT